MKRNTTFLAFVLAAGTAFAGAQMQPGGTGMGQPGYGQPGIQQPGSQRPDVSRPGEDPGMPGSQSQTQAEQNKNQQPKVDDATLQRQIHEQLASNGEFANVQVDVKDGVAHLEGSVPRKEDRKEAKKMAQSIPGVRGVKEKLTVAASAGSSASSTTGAENTGAAAGAAGTSAAANSGSLGETQPQTAQTPSTSPNAGGISGTASASPSTSPSVSGSTAGNVGAQAGTTTPQGGAVGSSTSGTGMTGAMSGQGQTGSATGETTSGSGSIGSQSGNPAATSGQTGTTMESGSQPGATAASTADLGGQIQNALHNEPTLANDSVQVNATDDQVVLTGSVASGKERQTAKRIAESFAGNRKVVDHLSVTGHGASQTPQQ